MKPSYFQNAQIETFERHCNCESKLNQLLWNEFLIMTLPLICWSSPRLREWPHTHFFWKGRIFFFPLQHITLNIQKLSCSASHENTPQKQFFTHPWLISHKKWKVSLIFLLLKCIISPVGIMASESEYLSTPTEKFTFYKVVCKFIKENIIKGAQGINL